VCAPEFSEALEVVIQNTGFGPITPNTVVLNWFGKPDDTIPSSNRYHFIQHLRTMFRFGLNIVILRSEPEPWDRITKTPADKRHIDVWWQNDATSRLMLLFAYLMTRTKPWSEAWIRVLTKGTGSNIEKEKHALGKILEDVRIEAEAVIVPSFEPDMVVEHSGDAAMVFLPFVLKTNQLVDTGGNSFDRSLPRLPLTALVLAAEDIDLDSQPEEGPASRIASATDALEAARKKAERTAKKAEDARAAAEQLNLKLTELEQSDTRAIPLEEHKELKQKLDTAQAEADDAFRRAAKARTKAEDAEKTAEEVIDTPDSKEKDEPDPH
jgi:hypothetical protein